MKKVNLVLVFAALLVSVNGMATEGDPVSAKTRSKICTQISSLLEENRFELRDEGDLTASVRFILNSENEIVVLSVKTDDERLEGFVKARLNYHKVADQNLRAGRVYEVPIRITA